MPRVHLQITREGATPDRKGERIRGATDRPVRVLDKDPATTFVVTEEIDTDHGGIGGETVTTLRRHTLHQGAAR